jgi:hypothetical protein
VSHWVLQTYPGLLSCAEEGTNQSEGLKPQEIILEHNVGQSHTQHLFPTSSVVVPFQVEPTSVDTGAIIQAVPPALQMILLPSGSVVPTGHAATIFACHQGVGPIKSPIFFLYYF